MPNSRRLGFAVLGLGHLAQNAILPAFRHSRKTRLVAVVSGDAAKARRFAKQFGASSAYTYETYEQCLANPEVDAVFVVTPNGLHCDNTVRAAGAGKHVLCEKPMANTVEECRRMVEACRSANVRLMIAYRKYFEPASLALKRLVASGKLGRLKLMHSAFTIYLVPGRTPAWRFVTELAGGGSLPDVGVYCVNTMRWLAGKEPIEALGYSWTVDPGRFSAALEENMTFRLVFPDGLVAQASSSFGAAQASFLHVHGERGWAALDPAYAYDEERRLFGKIEGRRFEKKYGKLDEFALELDAFADAIRGGHDPEPDGIQGMRDVAVIEAIYRSARENRPTPIEMPL